MLVDVQISDAHSDRNMETEIEDHDPVARLLREPTVTQVTVEHHDECYYVYKEKK